MTSTMVNRGPDAGEQPMRAGLLPSDLLSRRKSIYPGAADQAYQRAIDAQLRDLLRRPRSGVTIRLDG
jgi:hypothetical protein